MAEFEVFEEDHAIRKQRTCFFQALDWLKEIPSNFLVKKVGSVSKTEHEEPGLLVGVEGLPLRGILIETPIRVSDPTLPIPPLVLVPSFGIVGDKLHCC